MGGSMKKNSDEEDANEDATKSPKKKTWGNLRDEAKPTDFETQARVRDLEQQLAEIREHERVIEEGLKEKNNQEKRMRARMKTRCRVRERKKAMRMRKKTN